MVHAWLYSGSDTLWAGLIKELYVAAENSFREEYANAQENTVFTQGSCSVLTAMLMLLCAMSMFWLLVNPVSSSAATCADEAAAGDLFAG